MDRIGEVWHLRRGEEVLGEITITEADFPWLRGSFIARAGFAEVAPLFTEEIALGEVTLDSDRVADIEAWEAAYERITNTMSLAAPSGPVAEFLLHIEEDEAWFRWSEEPLNRD
jgi:hypothetical protein